ncbi:hypothetical protein V5O48_016685 [Marasmius crinis-equi]|uniref:Uncharacterized protein n=1 Tax=Marasmius crinis-equi TaxID=585013 RepID=A0ABR3ER76_9AGAR
MAPTETINEKDDRNKNPPPNKSFHVLSPQGHWTSGPTPSKPTDNIIINNMATTSKENITQPNPTQPNLENYSTPITAGNLARPVLTPENPTARPSEDPNSWLPFPSNIPKSIQDEISRIEETRESIISQNPGTPEHLRARCARFDRPLEAPPSHVKSQPSPTTPLKSAMKPSPSQQRRTVSTSRGYHGHWDSIMNSPHPGLMKKSEELAQRGQAETACNELGRLCLRMARRIGVVDADNVPLEEHILGMRQLAELNPGEREVPPHLCILLMTPAFRRELDRMYDRSQEADILSLVPNENATELYAGEEAKEDEEWFDDTQSPETGPEQDSVYASAQSNGSWLQDMSPAILQAGRSYFQELTGASVEAEEAIKGLLSIILEDRAKKLTTPETPKPRTPPEPNNAQAREEHIEASRVSHEGLAVLTPSKIPVRPRNPVLRSALTTIPPNSTQENKTGHLESNGEGTEAKSMTEFWRDTPPHLVQQDSPIVKAGGMHNIDSRYTPFGQARGRGLKFNWPPTPSRIPVFQAIPEERESEMHSAAQEAGPSRGRTSPVTAKDFEDRIPAVEKGKGKETVPLVQEITSVGNKNTEQPMESKGQNPRWPNPVPNFQPPVTSTIRQSQNNPSIMNPVTSNFNSQPTATPTPTPRRHNTTREAAPPPPGMFFGDIPNPGANPGPRFPYWPTPPPGAGPPGPPGPPGPLETQDSQEIKDLQDLQGLQDHQDLLDYQGPPLEIMAKMNTYTGKP